VPGRYYADTFDADGRAYIFDGADGGSECCGPFDSLGNAEVTANDLNTDDDCAMGLRPHMVQRRLKDAAVGRQVRP
jgi:hypothetical protein